MAVYQIYHFWMQKLMSILYLCCCLAQNPRRSVECQWLRQQDSHVWRMQQPVAQTWEGCIRSLRCNKHQKVWNPWLLCGHNFNENLHLKKKTREVWANLRGRVCQKWWQNLHASVFPLCVVMKCYLYSKKPKQSVHSGFGVDLSSKLSVETDVMLQSTQ